MQSTPLHSLSVACFSLALLAIQPASAAVFLATVGADPDCSYRTSESATALQDAIDAVPINPAPGDFYVVRVARSGSYVGTTIDILDRELRLEGGYANCNSAAPDTTNTALDANGANTQVIRVVNNASRKTLTIADITAQGAVGNVASGLQIRGADVILQGVALDNNQDAIRGAGLHITGTGLGASVRLEQGSSVTGNRVTQEGGGIYCADGARLELTSDTAVSSNEGVQGGGIYINGCSGFANSGAIGFPGLFFNLGFNTATFGGGALYLDSSFGPTNFVIGQGLSSSDPRPILLSNNASVQGGAVMAVGDDTRLTIRNAVVSNNQSGSIGGAIQARNGAQVILERTLRTCGGSRAHCSELVNNSATTAGGAVSVGGAGAEVILRGTWITENQAARGSAVFVQNGDAVVELVNSLITNNTGENIIQASDPGSGGEPTTTRVFATTIADNTNAGAAINLNAAGALEMELTIINELAGNRPAVLASGANPISGQCNIVNNRGDLPTVSGIERPNPGFIDQAMGDYRLQQNPFSVVDFCAASPNAPTTDYLGETRPFDLAVSNVDGPYDPGAYEATDLLVRDGFEDG